MNRLLKCIATARLIACIACGVWLLASNISARADDDAKKVIEAAIKAHGGKDKIAKLKDKAVQQKGKMKIFMPIEAEGDFEMTASSGKFRREFKFSFMGTDIDSIQVFDGKTFWISTNGMLTTFDKKEDIDALKEALHAEKLAGLALLGDKSIEASLIGDDKVGDTPVVGIRVSQKGHKDVSLYFDKNTHLLKKIVNRGLDFQTHMEAEQERIIDEYKDFEGLKRPTKVTVLRDGKKQVVVEISEMKYIEKPDDSTFGKPD
jgi:hypothetical protein